MQFILTKKPIFDVNTSYNMKRSQFLQLIVVFGLHAGVSLYTSNIKKLMGCQFCGAQWNFLVLYKKEYLYGESPSPDSCSFHTSGQAPVGGYTWSRHLTFLPQKHKTKSLQKGLCRSPSHHHLEWRYEWTSLQG